MMLNKILVPLDGSPLAEQALPYADALAEKFDAELILLRVSQPRTILAGYYEPQFYSPNILLDESITNLSQTYLRDVQRNLRRPARILAPEGYPEADSIIEQACQENVDLIVMSTHGRSGLSRWAYGSVADKVLQRAPCPVFLIRAGVDGQAKEVYRETSFSQPVDVS